MRIKLDENLPDEASELLRQEGHDADGVLDEQLGGTLDPDLATICQREQRSLLTLDLDFSDIRMYPPEQYPGIIVMRLHHQDKTTVLNVLHGEERTQALGGVRCDSDQHIDVTVELEVSPKDGARKRELG